MNMFLIPRQAKSIMEELGSNVIPGFFGGTEEKLITLLLCAINSFVQLLFFLPRQSSPQNNFLEKTTAVLCILPSHDLDRKEKRCECGQLLVDVSAQSVCTL